MGLTAIRIRASISDLKNVGLLEYHEILGIFENSINVPCLQEESFSSSFLNKGSFCQIINNSSSCVGKK